MNNCVRASSSLVLGTRNRVRRKFDAVFLFPCPCRLRSCSDTVIFRKPPPKRPSRPHSPLQKQFLPGYQASYDPEVSFENKIHNTARFNPRTVRKRNSYFSFSKQPPLHAPYFSVPTASISKNILRHTFNLKDYFLSLSEGGNIFTQKLLSIKPTDST